MLGLYVVGVKGCVMRNLRIGIAGMHIESGTFSPLVTQYDDFLATRGCEMLPPLPMDRW